MDATRTADIATMTSQRICGVLTMSDSDLEGVRTPPPVVYLGLIILGIGFQFRWPMSFLSGQISFALGLAVIGLSLILFAWTVRTFLAAKTTLDHRKPTTALISSGPFRFSRNPIYVSMTMFGLGVGVLLDNLWIVLLMLPAVLMIRFFVISKEEAFMESKFGADYLRYKSSVRRWL
jgi:protein-S-isoprenylcysteine O-methyltransferase Ste14